MAGKNDEMTLLRNRMAALEARMAELEAANDALRHIMEEEATQRYNG